MDSKDNSMDSKLRYFCGFGDPISVVDIFGLILEITDLSIKK